MAADLQTGETATMPNGNHRNLQLRDWVKDLMAEHRITQEELGDILGLSQAAIWGRLSDRDDKPGFKLREIEKLEEKFGVASPLRSHYEFGQELVVDEAIPTAVLKAVIMHVAKEYPGLISVDASALADAIIALCEYVQNTRGKKLTKAESLLALRSVALNDDATRDREKAV